MTRTVFEWNPRKASSNEAKHGVRFEDVAAVFLDPLAITIADRSADEEERWVTMGEGKGGRLYLVVHTYRETEAGAAAIRIISARQPTKGELRRYREGDEG